MGADLTKDGQAEVERVMARFDHAEDCESLYAKGAACDCGLDGTREMVTALVARAEKAEADARRLHAAMVNENVAKLVAEAELGRLREVVDWAVIEAEDHWFVRELQRRLAEARALAPTPDGKETP